MVIMVSTCIEAKTNAYSTMIGASNDEGNAVGTVKEHSELKGHMYNVGV
jgi:hypothetical protein